MRTILIAFTLLLSALGSGAIAQSDTGEATEDWRATISVGAVTLRAALTMTVDWILDQADLKAKGDEQ